MNPKQHWCISWRFPASIILIVLGQLALFQSCLAQTPGLDAVIHQQYEGHVFALRHPLTKDRQEYDTTGKLLTSGNDGPWTLYSKLLIHKITLGTDQLQVQAIRVGVLFNGSQLADVQKDKDKKHAPRPVGDHITLQMDFTGPLDAEALHKLWGQVFALTGEDFVASVPPLWRRYVEEHLDTQTMAQGDVQFNAMARRSPDSKPNPELAMVKPGWKVRPPEPISTPDPEYGNGIARLNIDANILLAAKINEKGIPEDVRVLRPLGLGIDEAAAIAVAQWRFKPATRDGVPVAISMNLEIAYKP